MVQFSIAQSSQRAEKNRHTSISSKFNFIMQHASLLGSGIKEIEFSTQYCTCGNGRGGGVTLK